MTIDTRTYEQLALDDPKSLWELHDGRLRQKPDDMTIEHNRVQDELAYQLHQQLDRPLFSVRTNSARTRRRTASYYIPDVLVVPRALERAQRSGRLEAYTEPLPLLVEIWSPSTSEYDVDAKLPEYQRRGDLEIWRIHPYERTLIAWVRQPDGGYREALHRGGLVVPAALPGVTIDLDTLFDA